jgi:hypothetical protein
MACCKLTKEAEAPLKIPSSAARGNLIANDAANLFAIQLR